jgi:hypothetical protein
MPIILEFPTSEHFFVKYPFLPQNSFPFFKNKTKTKKTKKPKYETQKPKNKKWVHYMVILQT